MFPLSDLDFLILVELTPKPWDWRKDYSIYPVFYGIAVLRWEYCSNLRTMRIGRETDITIATNLLEARFLAGNRPHFDALNELVKRADFWSKEDFFNAKVQEQIERYQRYPQYIYNLEWLSTALEACVICICCIGWRCAILGLDPWGYLQSGFFILKNISNYKKVFHFLFKVQFALHLILKRYDNRLLFDRQIKVSSYWVSEEGNPAVENNGKCFSKHYQFLWLVIYWFSSIEKMFHQIGILYWPIRRWFSTD